MLTHEQEDALSDFRRQVSMFMMVYVTAAQQSILADLLVHDAFEHVDWDYKWIGPGKYMYRVGDAKRFLGAIESSIAHRVTNVLAPE